ncbi:hypothetical protein [Parabacteroides leei]|uniref:hypothetical protein n=1 Tax=Parabacteroides leei TaxID=2939491 RepID=UPI00189A9ED4|nr:hypothetical protein [Parabacteroides goldsteinii]
MERVSINLNLFKLKNTGITELQGKSGAKKRCLIIPIDDNDLYTIDKGVYLNLIAFPNDKVEGQTHIVKQSFSKERREAMTEEEKNTLPILGGIQKPKEAVPKNGESYSTPTQYDATQPAPEEQAHGSIDNLPF